MRLDRRGRIGYLIVLGGSCWLAAGTARAGFIQTGAGPFDYNAPANWAGNVIDGDFSQVLTANQTVTFGANSALTTGWNFRYGGAFDLTLRAIGGNRTVTLDGAIAMASVAGGRTTTIGSVAANERLDLEISSFELNVSGTDQLVFLNNLTNSSRGLAKTGAGTLTLFKSVVAGDYSISAGTLKIGATNALNGNSGLSVAEGGTLDLNGNSQTMQFLSSTNGSGMIKNGGAGTPTFGVDDLGNQIDSSFTGRITGNLALSKNGISTFRLSRPAGAMANDYTGGTTIDGGTLTIESDNALPIGTTLTVNGGGNFDLSGGNQAVGGLAGRGTVTNSQAGAGGLFTVLNRVNSTFNGKLDGDLALVVNGTAKLTLTGDSTYTGGTTVRTGTLEIANNAGGGGSGTGTGAVFVAKNGTLTGTGAIDGPVRGDGKVAGNLQINKQAALQGGVIAPGEAEMNQAGLITVGDGLDLTGGGTYLWQLTAQSEANPGNDFSLVALVGGNLVLGDDALLQLDFAPGIAPDLLDPFWQVGHTWEIITLSGSALNPSSSNFATILDGTGAAGMFTTSVGRGPRAGNILLHFRPVPEPSSQILLAFGAGLAIGWGRSRAVRRRTSSAGPGGTTNMGTSREEALR